MPRNKQTGRGLALIAIKDRRLTAINVPIRIGPQYRATQSWSRKMMQKKRVWVLIADGVHAQIYTVKSAHPFRVEVLSSGSFHGQKEAKPHHARAGAGTAFQDGGGPRHVVERHQNPHRLDKEIFVEHLGDFINEAGSQQNFDELIIVAPNRALSDLRRVLNLPVQEKIKVEVDGEWANLGQADLERHLAEYLPTATLSLW
jgi:protein required for attachment to host cells